ncbi:hypothetical protein SAICODRAFT_32352 [Saitoella complicata NRRL Y-17804]|uniref:Hypervirulence associated protein TUDOR domain-containing protein n=1 Tax=Saitoella complicata (strain BCRC 22490 / CBS 7301 / JCM 7358 / NBRC 10748 / NRRL Y-17804) TaxID=698492 RepID=A0A0E9NR90_SAICN|nr:uncharacterized protein SAICODRAFT_32352 [Saitoella complicata NRRL Y-17804]ODQ49724.1 hypothetical protein SAICODRAFT_32352 [Saitoella complicata NRRL Y-17804]GAO52206.1 hypothetical protein G7K_6289-t1 [Saitoella complicata NRRL Y-17804]
MSSFTDKHGQEIDMGDTVSAKARGGKHAGEVIDLVSTKGEAEERGVKIPPKVILRDQHGHEKAHNPGTLIHGDDPRKEE